jgi:hypothetical protein
MGETLYFLPGKIGARLTVAVPTETIQKPV